MKILFNCIGIQPLFHNRGGAIQKLVSAMVTDLKEKHDIIVIGQTDRPTERIKVISHKNSRSFSPFVNAIFTLPKLLREDADVIISTHQRNFFASLLYAKIKNRPFIMWEMDHDPWTPPFIPDKTIYHKLIRLATLIITVSQAQKQRMVNFGIDPARIEIVRNSIDTDQFSPAMLESSGNKPPYMLYVAKFIERKNQLLLLEVCNKLANHYDLKLHLVGLESGSYLAKDSRPSAYYQKCLEYIRENGLEQKVIISDNLTDEELIELYRNAALFVFPSNEEAFGMTLLEAMACGCCCVANNIDTSAEIIGNASVLADINNPIAFAGQIELLLNDANLMEKYKNAARERAVTLFGTEVSSRQFESILNSRI